MAEVGKIFMNGRSQAVRLPRSFRFKGSEVYIRRDAKTGDVILSPKTEDWDEFFVLAAQAAKETKGFLEERKDTVPQKRELF